MVRLLIGFVIAAALCACAQGPAARADLSESQISEIVLFPARIQIETIKLSGERVDRPNLARTAEQALSAALMQELQETYNTVYPPPETWASGQGRHALRLAQHVLPSVSDHAGPDAHRPLGHDMPLEAWSLGPLAPMGEDFSSGTYALIPVCTARLNTAGHQIAQISLGAIFGAPTLPHKGRRGCHFALVNPATGNLTWRAYLAGGDFDKPDTMDKIATALVSHLSGTM